MHLEGHLTYATLKKTLKAGECTLSKVKEVSNRLCGSDESGRCVPDPGSGSALVLDNGLYGVSYEQLDEVDTAAIGDVVVACLASIPEDCPPGDDRGFEWTFTNRRTGTSVTLPDAEHMCGGA